MAGIHCASGLAVVGWTTKRLWSTVDSKTILPQHGSHMELSNIIAGKPMRGRGRWEWLGGAGGSGWDGIEGVLSVYWVYHGTKICKRRFGSYKLQLNVCNDHTTRYDPTCIIEQNKKQQ